MYDPDYIFAKILRGEAVAGSMFELPAGYTKKDMMTAQ